jgi:septal ring factor EnvC (AmiA/AmiB activator)
MPGAALTSAAATCESLRETPNASERQLRQSVQRVQQLQQQLAALIDAMERLEEQDDQRARAYRRPAASGH